MDATLLRQKLDAIRAWLGKSEPLAALTLPRFRFDEVSRAAVERFVQLVVDAAVDVNNHLILEAGESAAQDYYRSFIKLGRLSR